MNYKNIILLLLQVICLIGCKDSNNVSQTEQNTDTIKLPVPEISVIFDTINNIRGKCFLLENIIGEDQNQRQYRRLIKFDSDNNNCSYLSINSNINTLTAGNELDIRPDGKWEIKNDTLSVYWSGYHTLPFDTTKYTREILGKYMIVVEKNILTFKVISEVVLNFEQPPNDRFNYENLPYNDKIENLSYINVNCEGAENKYITKNFKPGEVNASTKKYWDEYNSKHKCIDQNSFDAGYEIARDQINKGLYTSVDYLFSLTSNQYDYTCFRKGALQYIADRKEY